MNKESLGWVINTIIDLTFNKIEKKFSYQLCLDFNIFLFFKNENKSPEWRH